MDNFAELVEWQMRSGSMPVVCLHTAGICCAEIAVVICLPFVYASKCRYFAFHMNEHATNPLYSQSLIRK